MSAQAFLVGGGIGSLAAAAFMIRDGGTPGASISILEATPVLGGSLDGAGDPASGYSLRGGRMLTTDNHECTWDLYKSIPSLNDKGKTVFDETVEFNKKHLAHSMARLVDRRRAKVAVTSMGFSMQDRIELLKLSNADEDELAASRAASPTGSHPHSSKPSSGTCGSAPLPFNHGIARWNSSATCTGSCSSSPAINFPAPRGQCH